MPIPKDWAQNQFYYDLISQAGKDNNADVWLDISRYALNSNTPDPNNYFYNTDGTRQTFFKWAGGEPNDIQNVNNGKGENYVEMILTGGDNENTKWNDFYNKDGSGPNARFSKSKDNLVMCAFTVPNTENAENDCGYGWEPLELSDGTKCVQINRYKTKIFDALAHCEAQGATLALPKNLVDNYALSQAFGYHQNEINSITGEEVHGHMNLWIGVQSELNGKT